MINHQPDKIRALISHTYQRYFLLYKNTNEKENIWKISGPVGIFTIAYQLDCLSIGRQTHTRGAFSVAQIINMLGFIFKQDIYFLPDRGWLESIPRFSENESNLFEIESGKPTQFLAFVYNLWRWSEIMNCETVKFWPSFVRFTTVDQGQLADNFA